MSGTKRFLSAGFLIISAFLIFFSVSGTMSGKHYNGLLMSGPDLADLKKSRTPTDLDLLDKLYFDNMPAFYDETAGRWFYSVPADCGQTDPAVRFESREKAVKLAFSEEITPGGTVEMTAYTPAEYRTYSLAVTTLPLLRIECGDELFRQMDEEWEAISKGILPREAIPMKFTLFDNRKDTHRPLTVSDGTVHIRGGSTLEFPKKGLRIRLLEKSPGKGENEYQVPLLGMRQDGDWLLYAAYNDQEKIRNVFSMNLWYDSCADNNSFGLKNGMEYRFVEMFINQQYWGLYALGFPVDAEQMEIRATNQGHYDEFLYKQKAFGPDFSDIETGTHGYILQFDADGSDENNGSMIMKMYFSVLKDNPSAGLWHNDISNAVDIWLFLKLGQAYDTVLYTNQTKNIFYTIKLSSEGRKILFTPWDADNYWGNIWSKDAPNKTIPYGLSADNNYFEMMVNPVSLLRGQDPYVDEMILERYRTLRSGGWSDRAVDDMLDGFEQDIYGSGAYLRDMERWPEGTYQDPGTGLSLFRTYVHERLKSMDSWIENPAGE